MFNYYLINIWGDYIYNPFNKDISEIEYEDLVKLIENEVSEEWSIEYKGSFPNNIKIAKSIASFANSKGGWYIVGIEEMDNESGPSEIIGFNLEENKKPSDRISNLVKDNIDPIPDFKDKIVKIPGGNVVLVIQVFKDNNSPYFCNGQLFMRVNGTTKLIKDRCIIEKLLNKKEKVDEEVNSGHTDNAPYSATKSIINQFNNQVDTTSKFNILISEFFNEYFEYLKTFKMESTTNDLKIFSNEIYENLEKYELLKKDLVIFLEKMFKFGNYLIIDSEIIIDFLSKIRSLLNEGKRYPVNFDFILRELFLYFIAYGLKYKNYSFIADLLYSHYYFANTYNHQKKNNYFVDLDVRDRIRTNEILGISFKPANANSFINPLGELLIRRVPNNLKELLIDADLLCCYVSHMHNDKFIEDWFPFTYVYKNNEHLDYFTRLISKKYFNKVKKLFDVNSVEEFKDKVTSTYDTSLTRRSIKLNNARRECVEPIEYYIDLNLICSER